MAKEKVNKSQLIRDALTAMPDKAPTEIAEALNSKHGLKLSGQYVSTIKSNMGKGKAKAKKAVKKVAAPRTAKEALSSAGTGAQKVLKDLLEAGRITLDDVLASIK
jgi:hypothetical protein